MIIELSPEEVRNLVEFWCLQELPANFLVSNIRGSISFEADLCKKEASPPVPPEPLRPDIISPMPDDKFDDDIPF